MVGDRRRGRVVVSKPLIQSVIGYDCEVSTPNGPAIQGHILARWMDEAQKRFDAWLEEHDRQVAERAWDEAAEIDAGCHDCIDLNGYTNPYRDANPNPR